MNLQPIADFFAHFSWSELVSAVLAAGIVAVVNIISNHNLAKSRDKQNREANDEMQQERDKLNREENDRLQIARDKENRQGNEEIQRKAEIRQYRTSEDDRRDADQQREQKERLQAVKSYYVAYTDAFKPMAHGDQSLYRLKALETSTKIFRLEATALEPDMHLQVNKILEMVNALDAYFQTTTSSYGHRASQVMKCMEPLQESIFPELMIWGLHGKSRKFGEQMDREIAEVQSW